MMKNPNTGRDDCRILLSIYEPVRDAIVAALDEAGELPNSKLTEEVEKRTSSKLWEQNSVGWFTTIVKLHLEATGIVQKRGSPQILALAEPGQRSDG